ncbi:hypothetical protein ABG067_002385 [Albugo candida]
MLREGSTLGKIVFLVLFIYSNYVEDVLGDNDYVRFAFSVGFCASIMFPFIPFLRNIIGAHYMLFNNLLTYGTWLRVPRGSEWGRVGTPVLGFLVLVPNSNNSSSKTYIPAQDLLSNTTETQPSLARPICLRIHLRPTLTAKTVRAFLQNLDTLLDELIRSHDVIVSSSKIALSAKNLLHSQKKFTKTAPYSSKFNVTDRYQEQINIIKRARGQEPLMVLECKQKWTVYLQFFLRPENEEDFLDVRQKCIEAIAQLKEQFCSK